MGVRGIVGTSGSPTQQVPCRPLPQECRARPLRISARTSGRRAHAPSSNMPTIFHRAERFTRTVLAVRGMSVSRNEHRSCDNGGMNPATDSLAERISAWRCARTRSDALLDLISDKGLSERPIADRHRFVFYLGHLEAFDWNLLSTKLDRARAPCEFDTLFAFGIDPDHEHPEDAPGDWPDIAQIRAYNRSVRDDLDHLLAEASPARATADAALHTLLDIAAEHRLMHMETLGYMLTQSRAPRAMRAALPARERVAADMILVPAGVATLGISRDTHAAFAWDNEYEAHEMQVPEFEIDRCMVTNRDWLRFMDAGGYDDPGCWRVSDWAWRCRDGVDQPASWSRVGGHWHALTLTEALPLPPEWPVYVSHAEASAYARWSGLELPSEAQWHRAAFGTLGAEERAYPWGAAAPAAHHGNFDFRSREPCAVDADPDGDSAFGVRGLVGNGWEWTRSVFAPFDGFAPSPFYPGYSADFFDARHYVLKGGSALTAARMLRRSFRNWFRPHYPYVFAGFRCVRN